MGFQNTVKSEQSIGIIGDIADTAPSTVTAYALAANANNALGKAYTIDTTADNQVKLGGSGVFAGVAVNAHDRALLGGLDANVNVSGGAAILKAGHVIVSVPEAVTPGMQATYDTATGLLHAIAFGGTPAGTQKLINNSLFVDYSGAANVPVKLELGLSQTNVTSS